MRLRNPKRTFQSIPITEIDTDDSTFATAPSWIVNEALHKSIQLVGVTTPLLLQKRTGSRLRIVCGFQRHRQAAREGLKTIPALITRDGNTRRLFDLALFENLGTRELSELEKAQAVSKLKRELGVCEEEVISTYLSALGIRPDRFHYERCTAIDSLPVEIQRSLSTLGVEIALKLARWTSAEQKLFLQLARHYRPSHSNQKKLFELMDDLRAQGIQQGDAAPLFSLWNAAGCQALHEASQSGEAATFRKILEKLHQIRYPEFGKMVSRFQNCLKALHLPEVVRVSPPPFFEGNSLAFQFSAQSPDQVARVAERLGEAAQRPEATELFELL